MSSSPAKHLPRVSLPHDTFTYIVSHAHSTPCFPAPTWREVGKNIKEHVCEKQTTNPPARESKQSASQPPSLPARLSLPCPPFPIATCQVTSDTLPLLFAYALLTYPAGAPGLKNRLLWLHVRWVVAVRHVGRRRHHVYMTTPS
ncbi:hypothetical protein E2C01_045886 [Portunus trituberculatus]|uniref:Uncharacterized protein n=1 Tax=Portunus trituberculatus TaxID=210409 RepID=A0A5B7G385_PORTR|nr:hypothetical protein [Portunus trituberculatus]